MKIIIVGGVAGGATAAARIRRINETIEIVIYEKSNYVSYANCGLPYYIGDQIINKDNLTLASKESLWKRYRINVKTSHEVLDIIPNEKMVIVKDLNTNEVFYDSYDKLLLAPGAKPISLDFLKEYSNVFSLRTIEDSYKIKEYISENKPSNALIIGGGFIGIEMAENLSNLGINVTIIQKDEQILNMLDKEIAIIALKHIREKGVQVLLNSDAKEILKNHKFDLIITSVGIIPDSSLAIKAKLEMTNSKAILVDSHMQTSAPDIYAVGDAVEIKHIVINNNRLISLAGPANKEARVAADNICGLNSTYKGSLASSVIKVFDMTVASTGITEKEAKKLGLKYEKVILSPANHATYYPNSSVMTLKVIYEKGTLRILGAQAIGNEGVEKRIDVIATAIYAKLGALELKDLDLSYAPPYSSAKDPVNMAGFIIDNIENGIVKQFHFEEIEQLRLQDDVILLDTRTIQEYQRGHASGFINIPLDELRDNIDKLDKNKKIYVMCQSGMRSYLATRILIKNGYDAYNFSGGYKLYSYLNDEYYDRLIKNIS